MTDRIWGKYIILRAVNHDRVGECTNLGCAVYGPDGVSVGHRTDPGGIARAIRRGDLDEKMVYLADDNYCDKYLENHPDVESVERSHQSMGHAMSRIQLGSLFGTEIGPNVVDRIYERYVLGKRNA